MKKTLLIITFSFGLFMLMAHSDVLWSLQGLESPRMHMIQNGEHLSQLAKENYGDAEYWRELALVNRAPQPDHVEVDEEILLPSTKAMLELRRSRTLTEVNALVGEQETIARGATPEHTNAPASPAPIETQGEEVMVQSSEPAHNGTVLETEPVEESDASWYWLATGLLAFGGVIGFVVYRRRHEELEDLENAHPKENEPNFSMGRRPLMPTKAEPQKSIA